MGVVGTYTFLLQLLMQLLYFLYDNIKYYEFKAGVPLGFQSTGSAFVDVVMKLAICVSRFHIVMSKNPRVPWNPWNPS